MARSLNKFLWIRSIVVRMKHFYYTKIWGMDIHPTATYSLSVKFDKTYPRGVHIGAYFLCRLRYRHSRP